MESVRLDKWLWAVRVYKTRREATEACRRSAVQLNGQTAKPSSRTRPGDEVTARTDALTRTLRVIGLTEKRVGAARVEEFLEDRTPAEEYEAERQRRENARLHARPGAGRPTKRDRREIERLLGPGEGD